MKKLRPIFIAAIAPTLLIISYPIFHGIQSAVGGIEGLDAAGMALSAIASVISAFAAGFVSAKENAPVWLPLAYLGYCLAATVLSLLFVGHPVSFGTTELYLTAIAFAFCTIAALLGTVWGRSTRALKEKRTV